MVIPFYCEDYPEQIEPDEEELNESEEENARFAPDKKDETDGKSE